MGVDTGISWSDRTKSRWHGCSHALLDDGTEHPGCKNCYAEIGAKRNPGTLGIWGEEGTRVSSKSFEKDCLQWQKEAKELKTVYTVFPSIHDPFEDRPELVDLRYDMFRIIDRCPNLLLLLLTKRPGNILEFTPMCTICEGEGEIHDADFSDGDSDQQMFLRQDTLRECPACRGKRMRSNVFLGASISDQKTAQEMTMKLVQASALTPLLFLSAGPLLGGIDLTKLDNGSGETYNALTAEVTTRVGCEDEHTFKASDTKPIGWVITEGESTANARPCNPDWVRLLDYQCQECDVPHHFKQHGEWLPYEMKTENTLTSQRGDSVDWRSLPFGLEAGEPISDWYMPQQDGIVYRKVGKEQAGAYLDGRLIQEFPQLLKEMKANGSTRFAG